MSLPSVLGTSGSLSLNLPMTLGYLLCMDSGVGGLRWEVGVQLGPTFISDPGGRRGNARGTLEGRWADAGTGREELSTAVDAED